MLHFRKLKEDAQSVLLDHAYLSWYSMAQLRGDGQAKIKYRYVIARMVWNMFLSGIGI